MRGRPRDLANPIAPASFLLLALLALTGCPRQPAPAVTDGSTTVTETRPRWQCPMHPTYVADRPGTCPICGMDLVPIAGTAAAPAPVPGQAAIEVPAEWRRLIGLRTAPVRRVELTTPLRATGRVTYDETRLHHVHTRYEAYVERLDADFVGKYVRKGEPLLSLYSPELYAAEEEYLLALRGGGDFLQSARRKLRLLNISADDIAALERAGAAPESTTLYAPSSGYVIAKTAYHGMRVKPEDSLFDIVDLSRVWVLCDVYEYELPRLRVGLRATVTLPYWPGRSWEGRLSYLYPAVDPKTRTLKARLEVDNTRGELRAELFADVLIATAPRSALVVPEDAVLDSGERQIAFVALGGGRLQPRELRVGGRAAGQVEVLSGLREGDEVAAGASFLIDSESRLRAALAAMAPGGGAGHGGHGGNATQQGPPGNGAHAGHGGHEMHGGHGMHGRDRGQP